jgi:hypothetical protein
MIKGIWTLFVLLLLSLIIMLAIGQVQLYLLTSVDSFEDIKVGFPFWYYSFSRDGNNFHGGNGKNLIIDFFLTFIIVSSICLLLKLINKGKTVK